MGQRGLERRGGRGRKPTPTFHPKTLSRGVPFHLWSLEADPPRGALKENRGAGQGRPSLTWSGRPCPKAPPCAWPWSDPATCRPGSPWSPFCPLTPGGPWSGSVDRAAGRAERGQGQGTGVGGWGQDLPWVPGRFGPGSLVTPADLQGPRVPSVRAAQALPGDTGKGGVRGPTAAPAALPGPAPGPVSLWCPDPGPQRRLQPHRPPQTTSPGTEQVDEKARTPDPTSPDRLSSLQGTEGTALFKP